MTYAKLNLLSALHAVRWVLRAAWVAAPSREVVGRSLLCVLSTVLPDAAPSRRTLCSSGATLVGAFLAGDINHAFYSMLDAELLYLLGPICADRRNFVASWMAAPLVDDAFHSIVRVVAAKLRFF